MIAAALGLVTAVDMTSTDEDNLATSTGTSVSHASYSETSGTWNREGTLTIGLTEGNVTDSGGDGWGGQFLRTDLGLYQMTFTKTTGGGPIPKDATKVLTMTYNLSWTRAVI